MANADIDDEIMKGNYKNIVDFIDNSKKIIRIIPDKNELKKLFSSIIDSMPADTLIEWTEKTEEIKDLEQDNEITGQETINEINLKIFPNPAKNYCIIKIEKTENYKLKIFDNTGKLVCTKQLNNKNSRIDLSKFHSGIYFVNVCSYDLKDNQTIKGTSINSFLSRNKDNKQDARHKFF